MARKIEAGIDYYPCNTDHITHRKIKLLFAKFNSDGVWIYECLKCEIYRVKGYYLSVAEPDDMILFAQETCKKDFDLVNKVIQKCVDLDLFDKGMFDRFQILTSDRIQENYLGATNRRLHGVKMVRDYLLVSPSENQKIAVVNINGENVDIFPKDVDKSSEYVLPLDTKKKEKEKESKVKREGEGEYSIPPDLFKKLFSWLKKPEQLEKYYSAERKRAQSEMMAWQREKSITPEKLDSDENLFRENSEQYDLIFKKHMGYDIITQIEDCYMHYARTEFLIDGQPIKAWIPVLAGWMKRRDNFKKKSA